MSSSGAGVVCLHAPRVHTVYTWEQRHRNKKPPPGAHTHRHLGHLELCPVHQQRHWTMPAAPEAEAHDCSIQNCLCQPISLCNRLRLGAESTAGHMCANQCVPECSGHKPRPCLQPSSLGTGHSGFSLPSMKANAVCPDSSPHTDWTHGPRQPKLAASPLPQLATSSLAGSVQGPLTH